MFIIQAAADSQNGLDFELYHKSTGDLSGKLFEITNTPIDQMKQTFVNVKKTWEDSETAHINDSITVRLYQDGADTGRTLTLNRNNSWQGTFEGLLYEIDGKTVSYTVVEDFFPGYIPEYSDIVSVPGQEITEAITTIAWAEATSLTAGNIYRFVNSNGYALTASSSNSSVSTATDNPDDEYQQWVYESGKLKNVGKSTDNSVYYLYMSGSGNNRTLTVSTNTSNSYTSVSLSNQKLRIGSGTVRYINLGTNSITLSNNSNSVAAPTLYTLTTTTVTNTYTLPPGYEITVNNIKASYVLPETGGEGTYAYIIWGLLIATAAFFLLCCKKSKARRKT